MGKNKVYSSSSPRMKDLNADVALKTAPKVGRKSGKKVYEKDGFDPIVEGAVHVWGDSSYDKKKISWKPSNSSISK